MAKVQSDKYANMMVIEVTESAANTLTFEQLPQITTLMEKKAFLINRIIYDPSAATLGELLANNEAVQFGLSLSSKWTTLTIDEPTIIDYNRLFTITQTAVGFEHVITPIVKDYSTLPGNGILIPTRPIYAFTKGSGLANPTSFVVRIMFTIVELTPQDYWDLVESLQAYS